MTHSSPDIVIVLRDMRTPLAVQAANEIERLRPYVDAFRREETRADKLGQELDDLRASQPAIPTGGEAAPQSTAAAEILDFLNSIEGHGYGGMASFEIARQHAREMVAARPSAGSGELLELLERMETFADHGCSANDMQMAQELVADAILEIKRLSAPAQTSEADDELLLRCNACGTLNSFGPSEPAQAARQRTPLDLSTTELNQLATEAFTEAERAAQQTSDLKNALVNAREAIVLAIAFLGRDTGSDRLQGTIRGLLERLGKADAEIRATLALPSTNGNTP